MSGWEDRGLGGSSSESQQAAQQLSEDLEAYGDPSELETLGERGRGRGWFGVCTTGARERGTMSSGMEGWGVRG